MVLYLYINGSFTIPNIDRKHQERLSTQVSYPDSVSVLGMCTCTHINLRINLFIVQRNYVKSR